MQAGTRVQAEAGFPVILSKRRFCHISPCGGAVYVSVDYPSLSMPPAAACLPTLSLAGLRLRCCLLLLYDCGLGRDGSAYGCLVPAPGACCAASPHLAEHGLLSFLSLQNPNETAQVALPGFASYHLPGREFAIRLQPTMVSDAVLPDDPLRCNNGVLVRFIRTRGHEIPSHESTKPFLLRHVQSIIELETRRPEAVRVYDPDGRGFPELGNAEDVAMVLGSHLTNPTSGHLPMMMTIGWTSMT